LAAPGFLELPGAVQGQGSLAVEQGAQPHQIEVAFGQGEKGAAARGMPEKARRCSLP